MCAYTKTSLVFLLALSCGCLLHWCAAQIGGSGGMGGWGGAPGAPGAPGGAPGAPGGYPADFGYGFAGVDSQGRAYGGAGGNGGYYVRGTDDQGRVFTYSGGSAGAGGMPPPGYGGSGGYGYGYGSNAYGGAYARAGATRNIWNNYVVVAIPVLLSLFMLVSARM